MFCRNDLWESSARVAYGHRKSFVRVEEGCLEIEGTPVPRSWLERISSLWCAVQKQLWEARFAAEVRDEASEWRQVTSLHLAMRDALAPAPLVLVSYEERLRRLAAEEAGIEHVDANEALRHLPDGGCSPSTDTGTPRVTRGSRQRSRVHSATCCAEARTGAQIAETIARPCAD